MKTLFRNNSENLFSLKKSVQVISNLPPQEPSECALSSQRCFSSGDPTGVGWGVCLGQRCSPAAWLHGLRGRSTGRLEARRLVPTDTRAGLVLAAQSSTATATAAHPQGRAVRERAGPSH